VQEALDRVVKGRSVLVIAHRLASVRDADEIVVLGGDDDDETSSVLERGGHADLVRRRGAYWDLYKRSM
jgi:ABC-type multidrug transport system fused ATPase/permease subunit